jgi:hypothetical protein
MRLYIFPATSLLTIDMERSEVENGVDMDTVFATLDEMLTPPWFFNDNSLEPSDVKEVTHKSIIAMLRRVMVIFQKYRVIWNDGKIPVQTETRGSGILALQGNMLVLTLLDADGNPHQEPREIRVAQPP